MEEMKNFEVVIFNNITSEEFKGMYGGKEKIFSPHSVTPLPRFLANHYAQQLVTKALIAQGKDWGNDSPERARVLNEVLTEPHLGVTTVMPTPAVAMVEPKVEEEFPALKETNPEPIEDIKAPIPTTHAACPKCGKLMIKGAPMASHMRSHEKNEI